MNIRKKDIIRTIHEQAKEKTVKLLPHSDCYSRSRPIGNALFLLCIILLTQSVCAGHISGTLSGESLIFGDSDGTGTPGTETLNETVTAQMAALPLSFIPNEGQNNDPAARFMVKGSGTSFSFTNTSMLFSIQRFQNDDEI